MDLEAERRYAYIYTRKRGYSHEDAEDFAQDCVVKWLMGRRATIKQLYIDSLRKKYSQDKFGKLNEDVLEASETDMNMSPELKKMRDQLEGEYGLIFDLLMSDYTKKEIANLLLLSQPAITVKVQRVVERLMMNINDFGGFC